MKRSVVMSFVFAVVSSAAMVSAQNQAAGPVIDDAAVEAAIRAGQAKKFSHLTSDCVATQGLMGAMMTGKGVQPSGSYDVSISGAEGLIAQMAADAKRRYKPFDASMVGPELRRADVIYLTASPMPPRRTGDTMHVASPVESIAFKSKVDKNAFIASTDLELTPVEWKNLVGGVVDGTSAVARFNMADVRAFPAGDFDVVIVTTAGERRCKVGAKDRAKILR